MSPIAQRYFAIEQEILRGRAHARRPEDREDGLLEESDDLWLAMTEEERAAADARGRSYAAIWTAAIRAAPRYGTTPGVLDRLEAAMVEDAALRNDTESILSLLRQLARARRVDTIAMRSP